ncbi:hypothetical protein OPV09_07120 [Janthinobacterium sp. TB1-E2]|uniref:Uncharacterized protein n=1 Tax=Janthinobacterium aestuarii TaxID=2985511 RepID=A0ABZ2GQX6_9BURK|nr:hypothetical protein [uncultured Janthinobacterium sp.]
MPQVGGRGEQGQRLPRQPARGFLRLGTREFHLPRQGVHVGRQARVEQVLRIETQCLGAFLAFS